MIRVLVADDHPVYLRGLCLLLNLREGDIEVVGAASNGRQAVELARRERIDVALLDIRMPEQDGVEAARIIRSERPDTKIVILTTFDERDLVQDALDAGVSGYLLKDAPIDEIVDAIQMAHKGRVLLSSRAAQRLKDDPAPDSQVSEAQLKLNLLAPREQEVFLLLAHGKDNTAIADVLNLSEHTVRNYVSRIYDVLDVRRRIDAVMWAQTHGIV